MFKSDKPITSVTAYIERLTKEEYEIDDLTDIENLIEAIRLQRSTGPTEAARAIRKKLKYGNPHRQLRALTILDDLISNAGSGFQKQFADEMLLERLRYIVTDPATDDEVKAKCNQMYRQWAVAYKNTPGMQNISTLYKQLPLRKKAPNKETSRVLRETERDEDDDDEPSSPPPRKQSVSAAAGHRRTTSAVGSSSVGYGVPPAQMGPSVVSKSAKKDKKSKSKAAKPFNFEKEKPNINNVITQANIEATGLMNALRHINRETTRVSDESNCKRRFESCKGLRRQTFRYCSIVMDEGYLGTLLNANDALSDALILFEQLDKSFDYDSDSEDYDDPDVASKAAVQKAGNTRISPTANEFAAMNLNDGAKAPGMPARPTFTVDPPSGKGKAREPSPELEEDDDDPFADKNEVSTPAIEKGGMTWRDI